MTVARTMIDYSRVKRDSLSTLINDLTGRGISKDGASWLARALHPPADEIGPTFVPDETYRPCVPMVVRPTATVTAPSSVTADETWDLCILALPGDGSGFVTCAAPSGFDFAQGNAVNAEVVVTPALPQVPVDKVVWGTVINTGTSVGYWCGGFETEHVAYRKTFASVTAYMTASSLYDGGTVTAAQVSVPWAEGGLIAYPNQHGSTGRYPMAGVSVGFLPLTEAELTTQVPGCRVAPAKEGAYLPIRLLGPTQPYVVQRALKGELVCTQPLPAPPGAFWQPAPTSGLSAGGIPSSSVTTTVVPQLFSAVGASGVDVQVPWFNKIYGSVTDLTQGILTTYNETGFDRLASGVVIFRGLHSAASITVKGYFGYQLVPRETSPLRSLVVIPPTADELALRMYYSVVQRMPIAYPARDNGLGMLIPKVMSVVRYVAPYVIPVLKDLAKKGIDAIAGKATKKLEKR